MQCHSPPISNYRFQWISSIGPWPSFDHFDGKFIFLSPVHHRSSHSGFWKTRASDPLALAEVDSLARLRSCWLVLDKSHCVWWMHGVNPWRDARKNLGTGEEVIDQLKLTLLKRSCLQDTLRIMGTAKTGHCLFSDRTCLRDKFG